jgi:RimJ/RimL family protein N-acetyltransferase
MAAEILLQTSRLYLRRFQREDAALLFDLDGDPEVMRFISKGVPTPRARIENEILPRLLAYYDQPRPQGFWAAHLKANDDFIGWFHLRPDKIEPEEMELGYRLKRSAWGEGLATEGSRALVELGFHDWGCHKLSARALAINLASRRVMVKAGLAFERDFVWSLEFLPGSTEAERSGVKYGLASAQFRQSGV